MLSQLRNFLLAWVDWGGNDACKWGRFLLAYDVVCVIDAKALCVLGESRHFLWLGSTGSGTTVKSDLCIRASGDGSCLHIMLFAFITQKRFSCSVSRDIPHTWVYGGSEDGGGLFRLQNIKKEP